MHVLITALLLLSPQQQQASSPPPSATSQNQADVDAFVLDKSSVDFSKALNEAPPPEPQASSPKTTGTPPPQKVKEAVVAEVDLLRHMKVEILRDQGNGRATSVERATDYARLTELMTSQKAQLEKQRDDAKGELAAAESGAEFEKNRAAIKYVSDLAKQLGSALDLPGSPACACGNVAPMTDPWIVRSVETREATAVANCIEQLRRDLTRRQREPNCCDDCGKDKAKAQQRSDEYGKTSQVTGEAAKTEPRCASCTESQQKQALNRLTELEQIAYNIGLSEQKRLSEIKIEADDDKATVDDKQNEKRKLQADLQLIKRLLVLPTDEPLILAFEDYARHLQKFSTGVEYDAIGDFLKNGKGLPRIGYTVETRFGGASELFPAPGGARPHILGVHHIFSAFLTGSAEKSLITNGSTLTTGAAPKTVFQFEDVGFFPMYRTARMTDAESPTPPPRLRVMWGPVVLLGARLDTNDNGDNADRVNERHYFGFRGAFSPFTYDDVLIGRTHGLRHTRLEVRGQIPIMKLSATSRITLGAEGNFSIGKPQMRPNQQGVMVNTEPDTVRVFLSWDANFTLPKSN